MRHRLTTSFLIAGALMFVAACDGREATAPPPVEPTFHLSRGSSLDDQIERLIPQLFPRPIVVIAFLKFEAIEFLMKKNKKALAQRLALELVAFTFQRYKNHQLIGDQSATTQAKLQSFVDLLFQFVGLGSAPIPPGALGRDGAVAIVGPAGGQVVTRSQLAGADFPSGAVPQNVIVTISRATNDSNPLPTVLQQFPIFYEFKTFPEVPQFGQLVTVAVCVREPLPEGVNPANLRIAHQLHSDPTAIEILPRVSQDLVPSVCTDDFGAGNGWMNDLASTGKSVARDLFWLAMGAPKDLSATGAKRRPGGLGGRTGSFSTFGAVNFTGAFVPYQELGHRFLQLGAGQEPPTGFALPSFDATSWSSGRAAFGSGGCSLEGTIHTPWPAANEGVVTNPKDFTGIVLRKWFAGSAQNVQIRVAVDNDVQVFVNGHNITATVEDTTVGEDGFVAHEGCADPNDPFVFSADNEMLQPEGNLVVVRARDRGVISYVDVKVTGTLPESEP